MESSGRTRRSIELLAPAGDWDCVRAAIENGADAVYFGLDCGFNARFRAKNFGVSDLPEVIKLLHRRGLKGYVTMNTLVFPAELSALVDVIENVASAGVDAVLVQDFGVARLVRTICPELEIHASTQMSLTSAETIAVAQDLGITRVVLARELSVSEIRSIASSTEMPLEVFIHGALCIAYSGQCLTSESLGGRSANRGHCAQACRLPYELVCDGDDHDLEDVRYLLSPQDLAGYAAIPDLIEAGIASLKIEGRLKTPEYVANITSHYRGAIDEALTEGTVTIDDEAQRKMELSFSRGFSPGWLAGNDHKRLVPGVTSAKRGIPLGDVVEVKRDRIKVHLLAPVALGDGLAITDLEQQSTQGGRIYSLHDAHNQACQSLDGGQVAWIGFGRNEIHFDEIDPSALVFKTDDPKLNKRLRRSFASSNPAQRRPVDVRIVAQAGSPLQISGQLADGIRVNVSCDEPLSAARTSPASESMLREKVSRFGGTPFVMGGFEATIVDAPMVPVGMVNHLRRQLVDELIKRLESASQRRIDLQAGYELLDLTDSTEQEAAEQGNPQLTVLCRNLAQLEAALQTQAALTYVDFHDIRQYDAAVALARQHHKPIAIATVRMQKPGEMGLLRVLLRHEPDFVLARNLSAIRFFSHQQIPVIADFSLNVANQVSADWISGLGVQRMTASYDLNRDQLFDLVGATNPSLLEIVLHQHMPMFHMEHCVFCSVLSPGTNKTNCGRPCDHHVVQLRDRVGAEHTLQADVACRNTLYNATPQSGAETAGQLVADRVRWFRIELLDESSKETAETVKLYSQLLHGQRSAKEVWQQLKAANRVGVTRGTLESKRNPLAIL